MKSDWTTISSISEVFDGPHATPKKIERGPYFLSISSLENGKLDLSKSLHLSEEDFKRWTRRVTPTPGDLLFSYETRLGEAALMPEGIRACLGRRMGLLRPDTSKVIPEYLLYAYLSPSFQETIKTRTVHGCTVDRISLKDLPEFPIRIPGMEEQRAVVDALKSLDDKIQLNHQINQTLEQIAQALFKSWFVDFEPVKAKIAAKARWLAAQPSAESASPVCYADELEPQAGAADLETTMNLAAMQAISGKTRPQLAHLQAEQPEQYAQLQATAALFPAAMQESELGETNSSGTNLDAQSAPVRGGAGVHRILPEGWALRSLVELINLIGGGTPKKSEPSFWGGNICWFSVKDVPGEGSVFVIDTEEKITKLGLEKSSTRLLPLGM